MLSFNDKAVSFVQSSSSSGYDIQRSLSRKRNQLSNFYDMELAMCDSCGTLFADKLKSMPCPKCGSTGHRSHWYDTTSLGYLDNIRMNSFTYAMAA
jgi:predicted Zn-ribbon and HTH transcriptional regulator